MEKQIIEPCIYMMVYPEETGMTDEEVIKYIEGKYSFKFDGTETTRQGYAIRFVER